MGITESENFWLELFGVINNWSRVRIFSSSVNLLSSLKFQKIGNNLAWWYCNFIHFFKKFYIPEEVDVATDGFFSSYCVSGLVCGGHYYYGPSTLATLFNHMWPRIVAGIFFPVWNHYFQALASTLQFVAQVCDRLWLVPATDRAFAYITYMSPPHVALVCSGPPQCAATCGWTKWPVCSGHYSRV